MKFSGSLLENKDIGTRIFNNSVSKTKNLLKDIFGLNFEVTDPNINSLIEDTENYRFETIFTLNSRKITAGLFYEVEDLTNDIITETLTITEHANENVLLPGAVKAGTEYRKLFWENVKRVQDYLEKRFELNYTPLDPEDKDENIISVAHDERNFTWKSVFKQDHQEGNFEVKYNFVAGQDQYIAIVQNKQHKIFLD
jgi:hypothetical protein